MHNITSRLTGDLIDRLQSRQSIIGVFGLGYVGLPLILR